MVQALRDLDKKMMDVELMLLTRTEMHSDDKWYVEAYKVYMNLVWLNGVIGSGAGDVQGGADYRPTDASLEILAMLEKDLAAAQAAFDTVVEKDVAAFNRAHARRGIAIRQRRARNVLLSSASISGAVDRCTFRRRSGRPGPRPAAATCAGFLNLSRPRRSLGLTARRPSKYE